MTQLPVVYSLLLPFHCSNSPLGFSKYQLSQQSEGVGGQRFLASQHQWRMVERQPNTGAPLPVCACVWGRWKVSVYMGAESSVWRDEWICSYPALLICCSHVSYPVSGFCSPACMQQQTSTKLQTHASRKLGETDLTLAEEVIWYQLELGK